MQWCQNEKTVRVHELTCEVEIKQSSQDGCVETDNTASLCPVTTKLGCT